MIKELNVTVSDGFEENRLILSVDKNPRRRYLVLSHPVNSKIIYDINFSGGLLLLGFNKERILNNLEFNIYREHWTSIDLNAIKPTDSGCLKLLNLNKVHYEFDVPIKTYTDKMQSAVVIEIGIHTDSDISWVAISDNCFVKILNNSLVGFWIDLSDKL